MCLEVLLHLLWPQSQNLLLQAMFMLPCLHCGLAGSLLQGLNDDSAAVQAAISEKVAHFVQHMTTATAGIIVAFVGGWDMTLVMVGVLPFLAAVGMTLAKVGGCCTCAGTSCCQQDQGPAQLLSTKG
jgi:ABC-type multidrug transport system fused ATPase/permease subunit